MKARINRRLFHARLFDSGAMGVLISVVHQFPEGEYEAVIRQHGREVGITAFRVDDCAGDQMQLDIDLSQAGQSGQMSDCSGCGSKEGLPTVSPGGYVLFHANRSEGGHSVQVRLKGHPDHLDFDSERLQKGDLCALSLLRPGIYSLKDAFTGAQGQIEVTFTPEDGPKLRELPPVQVEVRGKEFVPAQIRLISTQGVLFRVEGEGSRIVVELAKPFDNELDPVGPVARWARPGQG